MRTLKQSAVVVGTVMLTLLFALVLSGAGHGWLAPFSLFPASSAWFSYQHCWHRNIAWLRRLAGSACPQRGQVWLVWCGGTGTSQPPAQASL